MDGDVVDVVDLRQAAKLARALAAIDQIRAEVAAGVLPDLLVLTRDQVKRTRLVALGGFEDNADAVVAALFRAASNYRPDIP